MSWWGWWFLVAVIAGIGITWIIMYVVEWSYTQRPVSEWHRAMRALRLAVDRAQEEQT